MSYNFLLRLNDGRIALYEQVTTIPLYSDAHQTSIKICNPNNNFNCDIIITLNTPILDANICHLDNGNIIICVNKDIYIYTISENFSNCIHVIKNAHSEKISHVTGLTWERFATTSDAHDILIWSSMTYELICTMTDNKLSDITSMMQLKEKEILVSNDIFGCLKIWNLVTYQCVMVYELDLVCSLYKMVDQLNENEIIFANYLY